MSYTHSISNYGWTSGVSNTTTTLTSGLIYGSGNHWLGVDSGEQGEMAVVFAHNDTGATTHSLALMYRWNGTWTETDPRQRHRHRSASIGGDRPPGCAPHRLHRRSQRQTPVRHQRLRVVGLHNARRIQVMTTTADEERPLWFTPSPMPFTSWPRFTRIPPSHLQYHTNEGGFMGQRNHHEHIEG